MNKHWPLFDLRIETPRLALRTPDDDDLSALADVAASGVHDPSVMPFVSEWTDLPAGGEIERGLLQYHWRCRADWKRDSWQQSFAVFHDEKIMGVQDVMADNFPTRRVVKTGSWLGRDYQGKGFGKEMRAAVLYFAFAELGAEWAETSAYEDNALSIGVCRALGYEPNGFEFEIVRNERRKLLRFSLSRARWEEVARDYVEARVNGFDRCRDMFGV